MTTPDDPQRMRPALRWALIAVVAVIILVVLFTVVFPWLEQTISNPTLG